MASQFTVIEAAGTGMSNFSPHRRYMQQRNKNNPYSIQRWCENERAVTIVFKFFFGGGDNDNVSFKKANLTYLQFEIFEVLLIYFLKNAVRVANR